ncbi:glycosyltransferase family 4 protein [Methanothermobacter sp. EMTCatA1]|uniref:glycosyltransferase family 4 protein n=1 Tax=Methanothermobacter sp. EMTCatA1 TaxID=2017966 RepID=UPI00257DDB56|nr:glycosyltransferase family 4 protein [Methanothermobacter sp. EMTCatA1]
MGGAEIVVQKTAEILLKKNHEVSVVTTSKSGELQNEIVDNVHIHRLPLNIYPITEFHKQNILKRALWHIIELSNVNAYLKVKEILKNEAPDLVHIHDYKGLSLLSFKAVKDLNLPLVFTAHDYTPICVRSNLLNGKGRVCEKPRLACEKYINIHKFINPDVVTAPSEFTLKKLESKGLFNDVKKIVLPNPIETRKKPLAKYYDNLDILFVGSLSKHKGLHILIRAFKELKEDNLRLHIIGKGPDEGGLRKLAEGDERITFHGFLSGDELMNMYRMANVTVVPSIWYEVFGMIILESFINSTPVVASRIGGIPELVKDGYNGFLFEPGSVNGLKSILGKISDDPSILKELEKNAYESSRGYSIENHVKKLEEIYRGLL